MEFNVFIQSIAYRSNLRYDNLSILEHIWTIIKLKIIHFVKEGQHKRVLSSQNARPHGTSTCCWTSNVVFSMVAIISIESWLPTKSGLYHFLLPMFKPNFIGIVGAGLHLVNKMPCSLRTREILPQNKLSSLFSRAEAPITDQLRDYAPNLEKYRAMQIFSV